MDRPLGHKSHSLWCKVHPVHADRLSVIIFAVLSPQRIDMEQATREAMDPNLRHKPRLLSEEELPSWLLKDEDEVGKSLHVKNFFDSKVGFIMQQKSMQR